MRRFSAGLTAICLAGAVCLNLAYAQSPAVPTPATPGPNPGATATERILNPTRPGNIEPATPGTSTPSPAETPPATRSPASPSTTSPAPGPTASGDMRELLEAARATAKSTREAVEYGRVVPDILTQILTKLDKLEDKLDKVENAVKAGQRARR